MSLSTDCRVASLEAFLQARAMGTGTNAGGGSLTASRGDAPAPKKDQIKGSDKNAEGSAANKSGDIELKDSTIEALNTKAKEHNEKMKGRGKPSWTRVRVSSLKAVYRRGAGAFSVSHRPGMARDQWAMARVNAFLTLSARGRPENSKYVTDNDLLHSEHPKHSASRDFCPTGDARYASLLAFAQARDCGRDPDGKFSSGNTCAGGALAEAAQGAATGAVKGAITGLLAGGPATVKPGAAIGAGVGAVKGIYDNQMRPTRVKRTIENLGMTSNQVGSLVEKLGGTPNSSADTKGSVLRLTIRDKDGKKSFHVEVDKKTITVYPRRPSGELNGREIVRLKKIADESTPKSISVVVKKSSSAYVAKLVKNGFTMAAGHAADVLVANYATPLVHSVASDVYQSLRKKLS